MHHCSFNIVLTMSGVSSQTGFWTKKRVQLLVKGSWLLKPCSHEPEGKTLWVQHYEKWFFATLLVWEVSQKNLLHTFSWTHFSNDASWTCVFDYSFWTPFLGTLLEHAWTCCLVTSLEHVSGYFASFERPKACSPPVSPMDLDTDIPDITKLAPFKSIHLI